MRRIIAQARKELTQLLRDRLALGLALVLPVAPTAQPETMLAGGRARAGLIIPEHFERELRRRRPVQTQLLVDATDGNTAKLIRGSAGQVTSAFARQLGGAPAPAIQTVTRLWFNPGREPRKFY